MNGKRVLAILTSVVLAAGTLSFSTLAAESDPQSSTASTAQETAEEDPCANGDHAYEITEKEDPTCTEDGYIVYTCPRCGETREEANGKKLGHDYDGGEVTKAATESAEGVLTRTCSRCGDEVTESIPKLKKTSEKTTEKATEKASGSKQIEETPLEEETASEKKEAPAEEQDPDESLEEGVEEATVYLYFGADPITQEAGTIEIGETVKSSIRYEIEKAGQGVDETVTLTLDHVSFASIRFPAIEYPGEGTLVICLKGKNDLGGIGCGIFAPRGSVKFSGEKDASLVLTAEKESGAKASEESEERAGLPGLFAVFARKDEAAITVEDPFDFSVTSPEDADGYSISTDGKLEDGTEYATIVTKKDGTPAAGIQVKAVSYTVTYDANGGSGSMEPDVVYKGEKYKLPTQGFTAPDGKEFDQWQIGSTKYDAGAEVSIGEDTSVTALWKAKKHVHTLRKTAAKDAACEKAGSIEYFTCTGCGKLYVKSGSSYKQITAEDTVVPSTGHKWGDAKYEWAEDGSTVTASRVCQNDASHTEEETVTTEESTTATCEEAGTTTFTAEFTNSAFRKQTKSSEAAATGHAWGDPEFTWTDKNARASAVFTCSVCGETETVKAKLTGRITIPSAKENGRVRYIATATLDGQEYTDEQFTAVKPAGTNDGYKFTVNAGTWAKTSSNNMNFTVKRGEYDVITFSAFQNIYVDGKLVENKNNANYTTEKGSLKLSMKPAFLRTLSNGTHTLKIEFKDGSVEGKFAVSATATSGSSSNSSNSTNTNRTTSSTNSTTSRRSATSSTGSPGTGDPSRWTLWAALAAGSAIAIAVVLRVRKRTKG